MIASTDPQITLTDQQANEVRARIVAKCGELKHLLGRLEDSEDSEGEVAGEVHEIRKLGKALRGAFALFRLEKSAGRELQAIGRVLSATRDATVRLATWDKLGWNDDPAAAAAITSLITQSTDPGNRRPPREVVDWCLERVDAALADLEAIDVMKLASQSSAGFRKLDRLARKRCERLDDGSDEDFHEARKAAKAWLGAADTLPPELRPKDPGFKQLARILGDENDLTALMTWLREHGFTRRFSAGLWRKLERSREDLQVKAAAHGAGI